MWILFIDNYENLVESKLCWIYFFYLLKILLRKVNENLKMYIGDIFYGVI